MTRRIIALFSFIGLLAMVSLAANQEVEINLNAMNGYRDTADLSMGIIYVLATPDDNNEKARISIQVKNRAGNRGLLLFNKNHSEEKETKKGDIKKDYFEIAWTDILKTSGIRGTDGLKPDVFYIAQGDTKELPLQMQELGNEAKAVNLCFYPCTVEKKDNNGQPQKVKITAEEIFSIIMNVELGPDKEFEELKARCEALVKEINEKQFCPDKRHKPDTQGQLDELGNKCETITREIRNCASNRGIMGANISESKYGKLLTDINQAYSTKMEDFKSEHPTCIKNCPKHPVTKSCEWCRQPIGKGKNQCHRRGMCTKCDMPIGCKKGCKGHGPEPLPWKQANDKLDNIYTALYVKKISCAEAKKRARSIWNQAQKSPEDGYYPAAKNKYDSIMKKCK